MQKDQFVLAAAELPKLGPGVQLVHAATLHGEALAPPMIPA
jgi:hypothetical protein